MTRTTLRHGAAVAIAALTLAACGSASVDTQGAATPSVSEAPASTTPTPASESPSASPSASASSAEPAPTAGAYVDYDAWQADQDAFAGTDVVLFFAASWCPTCKRADANLTGDPAAIPAGLTIVKTDYDSQTELKQRYGVTVQHTFVQVDAQGEALAKWTGSETADEIAGKVV
jgi:thiol-disulfide isomerase/thioredoxin